MNKNLIAGMLFGGALVLTSNSFAGTDFQFKGVDKVVNGGKIFFEGDVKPFDTNVSAGSLVFTDENGIDFKAFCVDIFNAIDGGNAHNYTEVSLEDAFGDVVAGNVLSLFNNTLKYGVEGLNESQTGSFQLALWEILYESSDNKWDVRNGDFSTYSSIVDDWWYDDSGEPYPIISYTSTGWDEGTLDGANQLLNRVLGNPNKSFQDYNLRVWSTEGSQNIITFDYNGAESSTSVPEPSTLALIALGLLSIRIWKRNA